MMNEILKCFCEGFVIGCIGGLVGIVAFTIYSIAKKCQED